MVQLLHQRPGFTFRQARWWYFHAYRKVAKQGIGCSSILRLDNLPVFYNPFQAGDRFISRYMEELCTVMFGKTIERTGIGKALHCFFIDRSLVDTLYQVKNSFK